MTDQPKNATVFMVRDDLERIPEFPVPPGFLLRWFQPGDENAWFKIQSAAERYHQITPETFFRAFGRNATWLSQRLCFIVNEAGEPVGTAGAWFDDKFNDRKFGRVHWVAVHPDYQGRGLAKPLMTAVCRRLGELKHTNAYLITSVARIEALNLYLRFGFKPLVRTPEDERIWDGLRDKLKYPIS